MKPVSRHVHELEAKVKAFQMNTTPRIAAARIVNNRIKSNAHAYFERQRRPQAHLDRVMRLGRA